jgi:hypothetical protein
VIVYLAEYTSAHYAFRAVGSTRDKALHALEAGLVRHARQHHLMRDWYEPLEDSADVYAMTLDSPATRDGMTIPK